jgi:hypothetical protein
MNIFVLDPDPIQAARMLCDKHIPKMVLETAQLLCTTHAHFGHAVPYKPTHRNHPCAVWLRESRANYTWAWLHGCALADEYTHRYGKVHKSESVIESLRTPPSALGEYDQTPFVQCMPDEYRGHDAVLAYRRYYIGDKSRFARWGRGRLAPDWWV